MAWALRSPVGETMVRAAGRRSLLDRATAALMVLTILAIAAYGTLKPDYNWDMVAYVASALENGIDDPQALHDETWRLIDQGASEADQFKLKQSNPYNLHQWENPADFKSQLSMYRVKVAYITLLRMLEPVTGLVTASILLAVVPSVLFGALCLWWLGRESALQGAVVLMPVLLLAD